jgi:hypothetical protein
MTGPRLETDQNQNQNQNQNQQLENQNQSQELETPTPNTPPVVNSVPRDEFDRTLENTHSLYRQTLVEGERERRNLQAQLDAANARLQQPVQQIPEDQLTPAQLVERAVASQVAPLREQFSGFLQMQQQSVYQGIKNNFKNLPAFAQFWSVLEPYLDQEMQGKPITVEQVQTSLATVIGRIQMQNAMNPQNTQQQVNSNQQQMPNNQQQQQQIPQNQNQNPPTQQNLPAHLRPSAPPLPNRNSNQNLTPMGNPRRALNEYEKRVAREQRPPLTDDQYIDWISESTTNVIHSQIGIPPRTT